MTLYFCFGGRHYYPLGGMDDYICQSFYIDIIKDFMESHPKDFEWCHIINMDTTQKVEEGICHYDWKELENGEFISLKRWVWEKIQVENL
jgi:hypothetical protein